MNNVVEDWLKKQYKIDSITNKILVYNLLYEKSFFSFSFCLSEFCKKRSNIGSKKLIKTSINIRK
jgi:hypothetical protein